MIQLLYIENQRLEKKKKSLTILEDAAQNLFERMKRSGFSSEGIIDLCGLESTNDNYRSEIKENELLLSTIEFSLSIIAGSLLQIAKQGISIVHNGLKNCPNGRFIGNEPLKNIIWQGRNQTIHFEEGIYSKSVCNCFQNLETAFGVNFNLGNRNLALEVVTLLRWKSYKNYENDLKLLT